MAQGAYCAKLNRWFEREGLVAEALSGNSIGGVKVVHCGMAACTQSAKRLREANLEHFFP